MTLQELCSIMLDIDDITLKIEDKSDNFSDFVTSDQEIVTKIINEFSYLKVNFISAESKHNMLVHIIADYYIDSELYIYIKSVRHKR